MQTIKWYIISLVILGLLVWGGISLFQKIPSWVITIIEICSVIPPLLALSFLWRMYRRKYPKKTAMATATPSPKSSDRWSWLKDNWQWPLAVIISEVILAARFPVQYWELAKNPWFWVTHIVGGVVFVFFREPDKKAKDKDEKKLTTAGKLILASLAVIILANIVGFHPTSSGSAGKYSVKNIIASNLSHLGLGDERPEEDKAMRAVVVKFWQDNVPDTTEQERMVMIADEASRFNQFSFDGKSPLRRKVNGRMKVGLMGIDERMWQEVGNGFSASDSADDNLKVALYLYKTYRQLAWTRADRIHVGSIVIPISIDSWTQYVRVSRNPWWCQSGEIVIREKGSNTEYLGDETCRATPLPQTESLSFRSRSGKPEIVLLDN